MSYGTKNMRPMDRTGTPITIAAPSAQGAEFPHMLKQRNYATAGPAEFSPSHVSIKVVRHNDDVQQSCAQIFPTLSQSSRQQVCQQESEWNKHVIVASVAGLETRLAELDSQMRTAAPAPDTGHIALQHIQDHANILRENAQHTTAMHSRQKDTATLTHAICSSMNGTLEAHARTLQQHGRKQASTAGLTHEICSHINSTLETTRSRARASKATCRSRPRKYRGCSRRRPSRRRCSPGC